MSHDVRGPNGLSRALGIGSDVITSQEIQQSLALVQGWVERQGYRGYEPFDGLSSWLRPLALGSLLGDRLLQQLIRQCPLNLRPALGVKHEAGREERRVSR